MSNLIDASISKIKEFAQNIGQDISSGINNYVKSSPYSSPQNFYQQRNQNINSFNQNVIQPAYKAFTTPGTNPFYDSYQNTGGQVNVPKFNLTNNIQNPAIKFAADVGQGIINTPSTLLQAGGEMNRGIVEGIGNLYKTSQGQQVKPQQYIKNIADISSLPTQIALMGEGAGNVLSSNSLKQKVIQGASSGFKFGAITSDIGALQNINNKDTIESMVPKLIQAHLTGGAQGALAGTLLGAVSYGYDRVTRKPIIPDYFNGKTLQEAQSIMKNANQKINSVDLQNFMSTYRRMTSGDKAYYTPDGKANMEQLSSDQNLVNELHKDIFGSKDKKLSFDTKGKQLYDVMSKAFRDGNVWSEAQSGFKVPPKEKPPVQGGVPKLKDLKDVDGKPIGDLFGLDKNTVNAMSKSYKDKNPAILNRPIVVDETGKIVEGFHRANAAKLAGVEPPIVVRTRKQVSGLNAPEVDALGRSSQEVQGGMKDIYNNLDQGDLKTYGKDIANAGRMTFNGESGTGVELAKNVQTELDQVSILGLSSKVIKVRRDARKVLYLLSDRVIDESSRIPRLIELGNELESAGSPESKVIKNAIDKLTQSSPAPVKNTPRAVEGGVEIKTKEDPFIQDLQTLKDQGNPIQKTKNYTPLQDFKAKVQDGKVKIKGGITVDVPEMKIKQDVPPPPTTFEKGIQDARRNYVAVRQNIHQEGTTVAGIVDRSVHGEKETRLFRDVVENPNNLSKTLSEVKNPSQFKRAVDVYRIFTDKVFKHYNESGGDKIGFVENFYSHIIDLSDPKIKAKYRDFVDAQVTNKKGWFTKGRIFKNIQELEKAGFTLKNKTVPEDILQYTDTVKKSAGINSLVSSLSSTYPSEIAVLKDKGYLPRDQNGRPFEQLKVPGGEATFVSHALHQQLKSLEPSALGENKVTRGLDMFNRITKEVRLGFGGFHAFKTTIRQIVNGPTAIPEAILNSFSTDARLNFRQKAIEDGTIDYGSKVGITYGNSADVGREGSNVGNQVLSKNPINKFTNSMFGGLIDTYKIAATRKMMDKFDLNNPTQLKQAQGLAEQINNVFGGLNYEVLGRSKTTQQLLRSIVLAPDFNEGKVRNILTSLNIKDWSPGAVYARKNLVGEAVVVAVIAELGRKLTTGKFDNNVKDLIQNTILDPGIPLPYKSPSGKPLVAGLPGSNITDISRPIQESILNAQNGGLPIPKQFISARASTGLSTANQILSGKDYYGNPLTPSGLLSSQLPIPGSQFVKQAEGKQNTKTSLLNTIGLRVHVDPNDPSVQYMKDIQLNANKLNTNDQKLFLGQIHPTKTDVSGNTILDRNYYTTPSKYETLISNPTLLKAETDFQRSQQSHDPLWDLSTEQIKNYMKAQTISKNNPISGFGSNNPQAQTVNTLYKTLPPAFFGQRQDFFNNLKAQGVNLPQDQPQAPQMPTDIAAFWKKEQALPSGTGARTRLLQTPEGKKALAFITQQQEFTNAQRADLGLPLLAANTTGSSSYGSSGFKNMVRVKKVSLRKAKVSKGTSLKVKSLKLPKVKTIAKAKFKIKAKKQPKIKIKMPKI